jgi:CheY-like chemotaxis protein
MTPPTLLLADGSLTIRRVIELTFADAGIRVLTVADGRDAIERIQREPPDVILADIGMPERNGYEIATVVKQTPALAHIPVLLLAGALEPVDDEKARQCGADGVLVKPFEPQVAVSRVRELLARRPTGSSAPQTPEATATGGGDYLDRLDAAFAAMGSSPRPIGLPRAARRSTASMCFPFPTGTLAPTSASPFEPSPTLSEPSATLRFQRLPAPWHARPCSERGETRA